MGHSWSITISSRNDEVHYIKNILSHYREATGALIVFDLTNRTSFEHVK